MPPCVRWPLPFLASPAYIFHSVSPPAWAFRRWRRTICLLVYAGLCPSSPNGVHFLSRFSAGLDVSTLTAYNLPPCARWPLHFLASPACIFIPYLRRYGRLDAAGVQFASSCTLTPALPRLTGVHFSSHFSAGLDVSTLTAYNLPPCARWPLPSLASPACIFHSISPPAWASRR